MFYESHVQSPTKRHEPDDDDSVRPSRPSLDHKKGSATRPVAQPHLSGPELMIESESSPVDSKHSPSSRDDRNLGGSIESMKSKHKSKHISKKKKRESSISKTTELPVKKQEEEQQPKLPDDSNHRSTKSSRPLKNKAAKKLKRKKHNKNITAVATTHEEKANRHDKHANQKIDGDAGVKSEAASTSCGLLVAASQGHVVARSPKQRHTKTTKKVNHHKKFDPIKLAPSCSPGAVPVRGTSEKTHSMIDSCVYGIPDIEEGKTEEGGLATIDDSCSLPIAAELSPNDDEIVERITERLQAELAAKLRELPTPAVQVVGESDEKSTRDFRMKVALICLAVGVILLAIIITIIFVDPKVEETLSPTSPPTTFVVVPTDPPTDSLTTMPTYPQTLEFNTLFERIGADIADDPSSLRDMDTPQYEALNWLANSDLVGYDLKTTPKRKLIERYVLALLYFVTSGEDWSDPLSFLRSFSVCDWVDDFYSMGIFCIDGYVTEIVLWDNNLKGSIPTEIGLLSSLTMIDLSWNDLTGSIPTGISLLKQLEYLDFWDNDLKGSIPTEIGLLSSLTMIDLSQNDLTGSIPTEISFLKQLEYLELSDNRLTGPIPTEIGEMTALEYFYSFGGFYTGTLPSELGQLVNLHAFVLEGGIVGTIPTELGLLTKLQDYVVWGDMTGTIPTEVGLWKNTYIISFLGNQHTGQLPSEIGQLLDLEVLSIKYNRLTGTVPTEYGQLTGLESFKLQGNDLVGSLDPIFCTNQNQFPFLVDLTADCFEIDCSCCTECYDW